jgi:hypothetical protein
MKLFFLLLVAHFVADFYLQKYEWIMCKVENKERSLGLFKHILVHVVLTSTALFLGGVGIGIAYFSALAIIVLTHYAIDIWKTYQSFVLRYFLADQVGHLIVISLVSVWLSGTALTAIQTSIIGFFDASTIMLIALYLISFKPISLIISLALNKYATQFEADKDSSEGLSSAGELIGYFERGLIITFIIFDHFAGVGFLLAAKSVFRFGDMRRETDRKLTEYIMLGTLISFSFAIVFGKSASYLLENLG